MRTIGHVNSEDKLTNKDTGHGVVLIFKVPFVLLREKFMFCLMVKRNMKNGGPCISPKGWMKGVNISIVFFFAFLLFSVFLAGVGFIIYLIKSLSGLNILPFDHLF